MQHLPRHEHFNIYSIMQMLTLYIKFFLWIPPSLLQFSIHKIIITFLYVLMRIVYVKFILFSFYIQISFVLQRGRKTADWAGD